MARNRTFGRQAGSPLFPLVCRGCAEESAEAAVEARGNDCSVSVKCMCESRWPKFECASRLGRDMLCSRGKKERHPLSTDTYINAVLDQQRRWRDRGVVRVCRWGVCVLCARRKRLICDFMILRAGGRLGAMCVRVPLTASLDPTAAPAAAARSAASHSGHATTRASSNSS